MDYATPIMESAAVFGYFILIPIWIGMIWIAFLTARKIYRARKQEGKKSWYFSVLIGIVTFFLVTWDWLPSEIYYQYRCANIENDLVVHKTAEQWLKENQDLVDYFNQHGEIDYSNFKIQPRTRYDILFKYQFQEGHRFLRVASDRDVLIDMRNGNVLLELESISKNGRFSFGGGTSYGKSCFKSRYESFNPFARMTEIKEFDDIESMFEIKEK